MFERPRRCLPLQFVYIRLQGMPREPLPNATGDVRLGAYLASFSAEEQRYTAGFDHNW